MRSLYSKFLLLQKLDTEINMSALEDRVFQLKMQDNAVSAF